MTGKYAARTAGQPAGPVRSSPSRSCRLSASGLPSASRSAEGSREGSHHECHWLGVQLWGLGPWGCTQRLSKLREDLAPKAPSVQCLGQRQKFLPLRPVDGPLRATLCWGEIFTEDVSAYGCRQK